MIRPLNGRLNLRRRAGHRTLCLVNFLLGVLCGCAGSIQSNPKRVETSSIRSRASVVPRDTDGLEVVARLTVNDSVVEADELWQEMHEELKLKAVALAPSAYTAYIQQTAARLITDRIAELLLYQRASLQLPPEAEKRIQQHVTSAIRRIVATEHNGVERLFEKHLLSQGLSLEAKRKSLRREIIISSFLEQEIKPKIPEPTRAELLATYEAIRAEAEKQRPRRRMSLIDVRTVSRLPKGLENPSREQQAAARTDALSRIETARTELESGASFADVARRYSDGLHAKEGGAWGWITQGSVRERFAPAVDVLFSLKAKEVSQVVESRDGFFLVRCDEIDEAYVQDFEHHQPELVQRYFRDAYNRNVMQLVSDLRSKAHITPANLELFHRAVVKAAPMPTNKTSR